MDNKLLEIVIEKKELFVPLLFTKKQLNVIERYHSKKSLSGAQKKALYTSITKKMKALESLCMQEKNSELFIRGADCIIPSRLKEAKKIVSKLSKDFEKVFVSGSFLFSKQYNDIDIFIIRKRGYREKAEKDKHIVFLPESSLSKPVFQAASLISVSNFIIPSRIIKKKSSLSEVMELYHEAVIEKMSNTKKKESVRSLVFMHSLFSKNNILNGKELSKLSNNTTLNRLDIMAKELLKSLFSETYLYVEVHDYIKTLGDSISNIRLNTHLRRFRDNYEELIYGRKRNKAETA